MFKNSPVMNNSSLLFTLGSAANGTIANNGISPLYLKANNLDGIHNNGLGN